MMDPDEDHNALAAEYALGTLDADERAQVESMMAIDAAFATRVSAWEMRLGVLHQMVGLVEPRPAVWEKIKVATGLSSSQLPFELPVDAPPVVAPIEPPVVGSSSSTAPNVVAFPRAGTQWRGVALGAMAIAASLLAIAVTQVVRPDVLPDTIRPKVRTQVVQVQAPPTATPAQYVALLQKDGTAPAFILTVDPASRNFFVRRVDAEREPGKSYELWLVSDRLQRPRSLGVIGGNDFTTRPVLSSYDSEMVSKATYAVTVEPEGGAPNGVATGPIVFSGKLIETVPAAASPK